MPLTPEPPSLRALLTDRAYTLGRKHGAVDLLVPVVRISRFSGTLTIGAMHDEDVARPGMRPSVTWTLHASSKAGSLVEGFRGRNRFQQRVRPETPMPLHDGDTLCLVPGVTATLRWQPLTVCVARVPSLETHAATAAAARLGLHLVPPAQLAEATYVCVPAVRPNKTQLLALVHGLPLVAEAFVQTLLDGPPASAWALPDPSAFVPPSDPRLPPDAQISRLQLRPDARRRHLFQGAALFMVVAGSARRHTDMAELARAAGAVVHVHDAAVHALQDAHEAERALSRARAHTTHPMYVVVAEDAAPLATSVPSTATRLGLVRLPGGLTAITQGILDVQRWDQMAPAPVSEAQPRTDTPDVSSVGEVTVDVTSDRSVDRAPCPSEGGSEVLEVPPEPEPAGPDPAPEREAPAAPVPRDAPAAAPTEAPRAQGAAHGPSLPRRAGTRQARRSHLLDELLGVQAPEPAQPPPPAVAAASLTEGRPPSPIPSASPLEMAPLARPSLLQVQVVPMLRQARGAREARRPRRQRLSRRVALVLDAPGVSDTMGEQGDDL